MISPDLWLGLQSQSWISTIEDLEESQLQSLEKITSYRSSLCNAPCMSSLTEHKIVSLSNRKLSSIKIWSSLKHRFQHTVQKLRKITRQLVWIKIFRIPAARMNEWSQQQVAWMHRDVCTTAMMFNHDLITNSCVRDISRCSCHEVTVVATTSNYDV